MANRVPKISTEYRVCIICEGNYEVMFQRVEKLDVPNEVIGSSNFARLLRWFTCGEEGWMEEINGKLE